MLKEIIEGKKVIVFGDNDRTGRDGAEAFARSVFPYASEVSLSYPDGEVTESNGRDIRDQMNDNSEKGISPKETLQQLIEQAAPFQPVDDEPVQDETDDSEDDQLEYQPFPVEYLPPVMSEYIEAGAKSLRCDPAFIALPLLVVIASLVGASRVLRPSKDWKVPAILWGVVIADSGSMKSPAMKQAIEPLYKLQAKAHVKNKEVIEGYELRKAIYETRMKDYIKELAKSDGPPPDEPEKPDEPRIIDKVVGDVTLERLAYIINHNPKGIPIIKDEISGLIGNLNKYTGSKGSDEAVLLEGYNLGIMQVHRKHDPRDIFVPNAAISIGGNTQPKTYQRMMSSSYRESGFMSRFLKAYPPRTVKEFPGEGIPDETKSALMRLIESLDQFQLMETEEGVLDPVSIYLTREALQAYKSFHRWHNTEAATMTGDLSAEWSKLEEIPLRLSLIFHCVECVTSGQMAERLSAETMHNAIQITEWFKNESKRVYRLFGSEDGIEETPQQRQQKRLIRFVRRKGGSVKPRDVQQGMKCFTSAADTEAALNDLVSNGVGEWVSRPTKNPGRPSMVFQLFTRSTGQHSTNHSENKLEKPGFVDHAPEFDNKQPAPEDLGDFMEYLD